MANSTFPWRPGPKQAAAALFRRLFNGAIPFEPELPFKYVVEVEVVVIGGAAFVRQRGKPDSTRVALAAGVGPQEIDLHTLFPRLLFPANVRVLRGALVRVRANTAGLTTCTIQVGDTGAPAELVTASNLHTGTVGREIVTPAAVQFEKHFESAFVPTMTLTSTVNNLSAATAGAWDIEIPFARRRD